MKLKLLSISFTLFICQAFSQAVPDSIPKQNIRFSYKQLIVPTVLIGYGVIGLGSDRIKGFDANIREEVVENIDRKFTIDDFTRYVPATAVYALNLAGVKGKNNFRDRTVVLFTSYAIMSATVLGLKSATKIERPDNSSADSFPSGHTAAAFAGAEFLYQEYKEQSAWYGVAGYAVATGTGVLRIVNNRHWLTDVAAGAGIGILSTKIAYWMNPWITRKLFNETTTEKKTAAIIAPFYNGKQVGCAFMILL